MVGRVAWEVYEEGLRATNRESTRRQGRSCAADQYHEMVMAALWERRNEFYPQERLRRHDYLKAGDGKAPVWSIGSWWPPRDRASEDSPYEWVAQVTARLEFDEDNKPVGFVCSRGDGVYFRCGLTKEELVAALGKLLLY